MCRKQRLKRAKRVKRAKRTRFKGWNRVSIRTAHGDADGIAPVVISASRATDIPAFYADWLMKRYEAGYVKWWNRFHGRPQYVSFRNARAVVFWTKNPEPLMKYLPELDQNNLHYYFTFTLNDYEAEGLEPNVPSLKKRIDIFRRLSEVIGKGKVVWRFDPLIVSESITAEQLLEKVYRIGSIIHEYTEKLVVSFLDIDRYQKVKKNLFNAGFPDCRECGHEDVVSIAAGLQEMGGKWGIAIGSCAETLDLSPYGISHNKCIDDDLMIRLFSHDRALMDFLGVSAQDDAVPGVKPAGMGRRVMKDPGQRRACGCVPSKDIGQYNTCVHSCAYCYANLSPETAGKNYERYTVNGGTGETITGA